MKMKQWICVILVMFLMPVIAVSANTEKDVYVNGEKIELPAIQSEGEWMIPLRPVAEELGYTVTWYQWEHNNRRIVLEDQKRKTEIQVDKPQVIEYDSYNMKNAVFTQTRKPVLLDDVVYVSSECLQTALYVLIRMDDAVRIASVFDSAAYHEYGFAVVERDGKYGYVGNDGKIAIPCVFDRAEPFVNGYAAVQKDGKYGVIDETAEAVIPFIYDSIFLYYEDYAIVEKDGSYGIVDREGKEILPIVYPSNAYNFGLYIDMVNKGYALDEKGMPIMPFAYEAIQGFSNHLNTFCYEGKVGILDKDFKLITPAVYDTIRQYDNYWYNGMIGVKQNGKFGMIDGVTGELAIPCEYDFWMQFSGNDYAIAAKDGVYGAINEAGETVIPFVYEHIESRDIEGAYIATKNGKMGLIDAKGEEIAPFVYEKLFTYSDNKTICAVKNGKCGALNPEGKVVLPFEYDDIGYFWNRSYGSYHISLTKGNKHGIADENGNILIPAEYEEIKNDKGIKLKEECYYVKKDGLSGVLALDGSVVIPVEYDDAGRFNWWLLNVKKDGKWGYVNQYHEVVIPFIYDNASCFEDWGAARVVIGEEEFYIDTNGNRVE